jgi:hypothetical protein
VLGVGVDVAVERPRQRVGGDDVHPSVADEGWTTGDGVEDPLEARPGSGVPGGAAGRPFERAGAMRGTSEVEEVSALRVVELEGPSDGGEHAR